MKAWIEKYWPLVLKRRYRELDADYVKACESGNRTYAVLEKAKEELRRLHALEDQLRQQVFRLTRIVVGREAASGEHFVSVQISDVLLQTESNPLEVVKWTADQIHRKLLIEMTKGIRKEN